MRASDVESVVGVGAGAAWHARAFVVARAAPCSQRTPRVDLRGSGHNGEAEAFGLDNTNHYHKVL